MLRNFVYFCREAINSLSRNRLLSLATVSTVAICMLILGMAVLMTMNTGNLLNDLESDVEMVAFVNRDFSSSAAAEIKDEILKLEGIKSISFVSKEEALDKMQEKYADKGYDLAETLGRNPMPDTYEIKAEDPHEVSRMAEEINKIAGIYKVNYGEQQVKKLFQVTKWMRIISIVIIILLIFGAVFLIATTIRLAIFSRRKEIYLMKLIGATDWFVRWPFFIEGIVLGSLGTLLAMLLLALGYGSLISSAQKAAFFIPVVDNYALLIKIYLELLLGGAVLGVLGTSISVNRFLKV